MTKKRKTRADGDRRRNRIRHFVAIFRAHHDHGPTLREIADAVGLKSAANARHHVQKMIAAGVLVCVFGQPRTLNVASAAREPRRGIAKVPLLGPIGAAIDFEVPDAIDAAHASELDMLEVPENLVGGATEVFALAVQGDSMKDAMVCDGDKVLLEATSDAQRGNMVAARIERNGAFTTTLKYYHPPRAGSKDRRITLKPANSDLEPIKIAARNCRIQGRVVAVLRQY